MNFCNALHDSCRELQLDAHIKEIKYKKDAHTYAEKIAVQFGKLPKEVKNSYMYLDALDFCFYQNGNDVDFAISGNVRGNDKLNIKNAIDKALKLCELTEQKMKIDEVD